MPIGSETGKGEGPAGTPSTLLPDPLARRLRIRSVRRERDSQLRELVELSVEMRRVGSDNPALIERRLAGVAAVDEELLSLQAGETTVAPSTAPSGARGWAPIALAAAGAALVAALVVLLWPASHDGSPTRSVANHGTKPAGLRPAGRTGGTRAASPRAKPKPKPKPKPVRLSAAKLGQRTLSLGSHGADVRLLQRLLRTPGKGVYDARTVAAVKRFQLAHDLPGTGVTAQGTHAKLKKLFP